MRVILCDDNLDDLARYSEIVKISADKIHEPLDFLQCTNGEQVKFALEDSGITVDAVFLDITMPGIDGMKTAWDLRGTGYVGPIIFLTGSNKRWREAFDVKAINYLVKAEVTQQKMDAVVREIVTEAHRKSQRYISVISGGLAYNIRITDIMYLDVNGRIMTIYQREGKPIPFLGKMATVEQRLSIYGFVRVHRSFLVATAYVRSYTSQEVTLYNGQVIPSGKTGYRELSAALQGDANRETFK